jgi:phospholipid transport system substrate-binding protein
MSQLTEFFARHVRRLLLLAIAMAALLLGPQPAPAQDAGNSASPGSMGPLSLVESSVSRVMALVKSQPDTDQRRAAVRQVAATLFDFNEMARRTLAQRWSDRSPQEQEEFVRLFPDLLARSYLTVIGSYRLGTITSQRESVDGSSARVYSRILTDRGTEIPIEYRLLQTVGQWAVYDVVAGDVSLVSSYRSQFGSIIRASSFATLLDRLRTREAGLIPGANQGQ